MNRQNKQHLTIATICSYIIIAMFNTTYYLLTPEGAGYNEQTIPLIITLALLIAVFVNPLFYLLLAILFTFFYWIGKE